MLWIAVVTLLVHSCAGYRYIEVRNNNDFPIWIHSLSDIKLPQFGLTGYRWKRSAWRSGIEPPQLEATWHSSMPFILESYFKYALLGRSTVKLDPGESFIFDIDDKGWTGRLWPKTGCDDDGNNCELGRSIRPCPDGCHQSAQTKVAFFFPPMWDVSKDSYYKISFIDGYSLSSEIIPYEDSTPLEQGSCIRTLCRLRLEDCPTSEKSGLGDLTVRGRGNKTIACLSPCKKWNLPEPYGMGRNEEDGDGRLLCCPSSVSVDECRNGIIENTDFVQLVRSACPSAYSYDDQHDQHYCPKSTSFVVNFFS